MNVETCCQHDQRDLQYLCACQNGANSQKLQYLRLSLIINGEEPAKIGGPFLLTFKLEGWWQRYKYLALGYPEQSFIHLFSNLHLEYCKIENGSLVLSKYRANGLEHSEFFQGMFFTILG